MSAFGMDGFASVESVEVELYTAAYRVSGTVHTPFRRVAEILNQLPGAHLTVESATIEEHAAPEVLERASSTLITVDEVLVLIAPGLAAEGRAEMRIQKQPARTRMSIPPLHLEGDVHVPVGSLPADALLNVPQRFFPMTDVALTSAAHPSLDRQVPIMAVRRDRVHIVTFVEAADDDTGDEAAGGTPMAEEDSEG
jgi:hypothetical protein